MHNIMKLKNMN